MALRWTSIKSSTLLNSNITLSDTTDDSYSPNELFQFHVSSRSNTEHIHTSHLMHRNATRIELCTSDILVLKLILVLVFILFSSQNFYFI